LIKKLTKNTGGGIVNRWILLDAELKTGKTGQKTELPGSSPLGGEGLQWTVVLPEEKR
jgi:hypothetical protein